MNEERKETPEESPEISDEQTASEEAKDAPQTPSLYRNVISFAGTAIAAASLMCIAFLFLIEVTSAHQQPYLDIFTYLLFPSILVFGLLVVLAGILLERRRRRKLSPAEIAAYPILDLNNPRQRRTFLVFLCAAFLFLFMSAFGSYRVFEYTESVPFCGQTCHVMKPEFTAYQASPHARVACVHCHVGSGAEWYVRSKFNGMHQLYAVTFNTYHRPIETPIQRILRHMPLGGLGEAIRWQRWPGGQRLYLSRNGLDIGPDGRIIRQAAVQQDGPRLIDRKSVV